MDHSGERCVRNVVPPKNNRKNPWDYDKQLYKQRNQVERFFRRIKRFRRIFTRYDKLDLIFLAFVYFALIVDALMGTLPNSRTGRGRKSLTPMNEIAGVYERNLDVSAA